MCLAVPGKILELTETFEYKQGRVDFGGTQKTIDLSFLPEAQVGNYVIAHVGVAISLVDEEEAEKTLEAWAEYRRLDPS